MNKDYQKQYRLRKLAEDPVAYRAKLAETARRWRAKHPDNARKFVRNKNGVGEIPSDDGVLFYGYKEPLRKFQGGYGYLGVITYSKDRDKIQCHLCGRLFKFLNNGHLMQAHNVTSAQYKEKVELSPSASLVGEGTRKKLYERPYNPNHLEELKKVWANRRELTKKNGKDPQSHPKQRLEIKNKKGTCPDQLLDLISKTVTSYGHVPTEEEFLKFHHGKFMGSIRNTFGTWTNALSKLDLKTNAPRYEDTYLLDAIKNFYHVNKRTPRWTDFNRGLLPSPNSYYSRWRGLNHARLLAGVPLLLEVGGRREEWIPSEDERKKMLAKY